MQKFKNINTEPKIPIFKRERALDFSELVSDKIELTFVFIWALAMAMPAIYAFLNFSGLSNQIPLFYSRVWGDGQLAPRNYIYLPTLGVLVFGIINIGLTLTVKKDDKLFKYLLLSATAIVAVLSAITIFNIVGLIV